jgi:hypothetical protein
MDIATIRRASESCSLPAVHTESISGSIIRGTTLIQLTNEDLEVLKQ